MKFKRIISWILSVVLMMSMITIPEISFAYDDSTEGLSDARADISFVYMGKATKATNANYGKIPSGAQAIDTDLAVGEYIWVGVQMSNMTAVKDLMEDNGSNGGGGIGTLCLGMAYDSEYLSPITVAGALFNNSGVRDNYPKMEDYSAHYSLSGANGGLGYSTDGSEENKLTNTDNSSDITLEIGLNYGSDAIGDYDSDVTRMFQTVDNDDPVTVAAFIFEIVQVPDSGAKVLQAHLAGDRFTMGVGFNADFTTQWISERSTDSSQNLKNYFDLTDASGNPTDGVIDIFPVTYGVNFYTDNTYNTLITSASGDTLGASGIAEGTAVADAGIVEPVAGIDFDLVNTDDNYFNGFKYVDSTGTEQSYEDLTTIDATAAVDGGSEIKVYPAYVPGTDLTFHGNYPDSTDSTKTVTVSPASDATIPESLQPTVGTAGTEDFTIPTGYVFGGWYDNAACTGDAIVFDDTSDESDNPTLVADLAGTDIYAKWVDAIKVEFVKVKDSADAGNVVETYYIDPDAADKTVAAPASNPTREGYVFDKWCYDVDGTATDFVAKGNAGATEFSENTTVYATWKKSVKVIYYDTDRATELKNETIVTGDSFTPPTVNDDTENNKYFNGWKKVDDDTAFDVSQPLSADITADELKLYVDMKDAYTVKFYKEAEKTNLLDTKYSNSVTPAALGDANMPADPTETGKKFSGWKVVGTDATFDETTVVNGDMEVYAAWDSLWKIDFYEDDDDTTAAHTKYVDPDVKKLGSDMPTDPAARTGYRFEGYYINGTNTKVDGNTEFSGDTKVVGKWTQLFEVEFYPTLADAQAGTNKLAAETVDSGNKVSASTVPTVNDDDDAKKYFKGWKTVDGAEFDPVNDTVTSDLKLYEDWGDYYKVEFYKEATDIPGTVYDTKYVNPNEATTLSALPTDPTKTGFGFNEWKVYADGAVTTTKFDTSTEVSADMTVVADWIQKVKISFYPNDGTGAGALGTVQEVYVTPNVTFDGTVPTVTRTGYTLKEWNTASNGSGTSYANVAAATFTADTTLYAIWIATGADQATLTFDANLDGVTPNPSSVTVNVNDKVYSSNIPVVAKDDYTFDGWYASPSISDTAKIDFSAGYTVTENKTVYAHWTYTGADKVTVTFMNDSSEYAKVDVAPNTTLGTMMPTAPTKTGFAFKEWNTASDGQGTKFDKDTNVGTDPTVTVYSQWTEDITVTYDANTGTGGPGSVTAPAGDKYVDPTTLPTKTNYEFAGWNTKTNGAGATIAADGSKTYADIAAAIDPDSSSVTVYAQWVPADGQDTATLTFDTVGGDAAKPASITVVKGDTIVASQMPDTPTKTSATGDKYTFLGWYEAATLTNTKQITVPITMDADKTAYAHWDYSGTDKITITFNDNGATTAVSPTTINIGKGDSIGDAWPTAPEKTGFTFGGWYTDVTDDTTKKDKDSVFEAATTLNAKWIENITVTYDANQGSNPPAPVTKPAGDKYEDPDTANMTRPDYHLLGWNTKQNGSGTYVEANGTLTYADVAALDGNTGSSITLYAIWDAGPDPDDDDPDAPTVKGIQVIFNTNATGAGVVDANPNSTSVDDGDAIGEAQMPNIPVRPDHQFLGWNTQENGGGLDLTGTSVISTTGDYGNYMFGSLSGVYEWDLNVYAQWKYTGADAVTVNFMNDGSQYATITVAPNTTLAQYMPDDPEKTGAAFKEWNTAEDGTGTKFESTTNVGAGPATVTVYAQWVEDITVNYNANGGTDGPASVTKPAADAYEDPDVTNMAKDGYTFVGWNTKQNGSGTYVIADGTLTYADVAEMFTPDGGTAPTEVTVYAQWAWTPDDDDTIDDIIDDTPVDPDPNGVRVTFDSNSAGATTAVVDANPKYKYPQLGDAIGTDNMPNEPTREKYTFKGWNTAQDGSGVAFSGTTTVDSATLGDALVEIMENDLGTGKYEVTLYAQWEVASDVAEEDKVTVTFNKNLDGSGAAGDVIKTVTLYKGDALGYDVTAPKNGTYEFNGWYAGSVVDGKVSFTTNKFASTTAINADTDYYAQWQMYLLVQVQPKVVDGATVDYTYTGQEIKPTYKIYQIVYPDGDLDQPYEIVGTHIYEGTLENSQFTATYTKNSAAATLKDVGTYKISVKLNDDSALKATGAKIAVTDPATIEIKEAGLEVQVDPASQINKGGDGSGVTIAVYDSNNNAVSSDGTIYKVYYYPWSDSNNDGVIAESELLTDKKTEIAPTEVGKYVVKVELQNTNYIIETVTSSGVGDVLVYGVTADYPTYPDGKTGQNLVFEIIPNDPSIKTVAVKSVDNVDEEGNPVDPAVEENLTLKKNDYTTDETFDNAEEPEVTDYYIRVTDKDADDVTFTLTLTNPETTTLTATGGTVVKNDDGTYTVTAPLTNKGATPNVVTVTTKAGDAEDAPTLTYTFTIQQLVDAKIVLNPGNSPYGLIQRMANAVNPWDAEKIQAAKDAFNNSHTTNKTYGDGYVPDNGQTEVKYTTVAWDDIGTNYDMDEDAIFVYEAATFTDPGFTIYDQTGAKVTADSTNFKKELSVTVVGTGVPTYADNEGTVTALTETDGKYSLSGKIIRPDLYKIKYTYTYTDLADSSTQTLVIERPIIILSKRGDVSLTTLPLLNANDASDLKNNWTKLISRNALFAFRSGDINITTLPLINANDASDLKNKWMHGFTEFYTVLD